MTEIDNRLRVFSGYNMKRAFNAIQADVNRTLQPFGLRMVTFSCLSIVVSNPGIRQSQLADTLSIERPNLVQILDELEVAGLISRERARDDRRSYELEATLPGRRLYEKAERAVVDHDDRMTAQIDASERQLLNDMLQRVERAGSGTGLAEESSDKGKLSRA